MTMICALPARAQAPDGRLTVLGRGVVERTPDHAVIQVGVSTRAPTPTEALDANSASAARVIAFAKRFGVQATDIRTRSVDITANFRMVSEPGGRSRQEPDGYSASNRVAIVIRDLARLGLFLRDVLNEGANGISGVVFGLNDPAEAGDAARLAAVEDATRKASLLAGATKTKLGRVLQIDHPPRAEHRPSDGAADLPSRRGRLMAVPIETGVIEVSAEVEISWATE
jgi:uncharacterized protein YggE